MKLSNVVIHHSITKDSAIVSWASIKQYHAKAYIKKGVDCDERVIKSEGYHDTM